MKVVATVGFPGSGKSVFEDVAGDLGVPVVSMGDVIRNEVDRRGLEQTDDNLGDVAVELRERHGDDVVAERCVDLVSEALEDSDDDVVLVDGVRGEAEVELFREEFGDALEVVAVEVPFDVRLERLSERGRSDDMSSEEELRRRDERERGYGLDEAMEGADTVVENVGTINEFKDVARGVLQDGDR